MKKYKTRIIACILLSVLLLSCLASCTDAEEQEITSTDENDVEIEETVEYTGANWMSALDGGLSLGSIAMPGTHDSGATKEPLAGTAKCQTLTIAKQLEAGVRYFDIRLRREDGKLNVYHGYVNQELSFDQVLDDCYAFLESNPTEAIVMCIKEEYDAAGANSAFDVMVKKHIDADPDKWYVEEDVPMLDSVRGRIALMRRYSTSKSFGFNASSGWSDNTSFTMKTEGGTLRCQDHYELADADEKWDEIESFFSKMKPRENTYYLNNTSGYVSGLFGIPNITDISDSVNQRLVETLTTERPDIVGIIAADFMTEEIAKAIYSLNFDN